MDQSPVKLNQVEGYYPLVFCDVELPLFGKQYAMQVLCYEYEMALLQQKKHQINNIFLRLNRISEQLYDDILNNEDEIPYFQYLRGKYTPTDDQSYLNYYYWNSKQKYKKSDDALQSYFSTFKDDDHAEHKQLLQINSLQMAGKTVGRCKFMDTYFSCEAGYLYSQQQTPKNQVSMMATIIQNFQRFQKSCEDRPTLMRQLDVIMLKYYNFQYRVFKLQNRLDHCLSTFNEIQKLLTQNLDSLLNSFNDHIAVLDSVIVLIDYQVSSDNCDRKMIQNLVKDALSLLKVIRVSKHAVQYKNTIYINNGPFLQWYNMVMALSQLVQSDYIEAEWIAELPSIIDRNDCEEGEHWIYFSSMTAANQKLKEMDKAIENCKMALAVVEEGKGEEWLECVVQLQSLYLEKDEYLLGYQFSQEVEDDVFNRVKNNEVKLFEQNQEFFRLALKE